MLSNALYALCHFYSTWHNSQIAIALVWKQTFVIRNTGGYIWRLRRSKAQYSTCYETSIMSMRPCGCVPPKLQFLFRHISSLRLHPSTLIGPMKTAERVGAICAGDARRGRRTARSSCCHIQRVWPLAWRTGRFISVHCAFSYAPLSSTDL